MATPALYGLYPSVIGGVTINNIDSCSPSPGVELMLRTPGGSIDPALVATAFAEPIVKLGSHDVQSVLAGISFVNGLAFNSAKIQYQQRAQGGVFLGSGNHISLSSTLGAAWIEDFGASQDDKEGADINLAYAALYDGTNFPLVVNTAQALSGSPAVNAIHALGPVNFEGITGGLTGVQKVRIKSGMKYRVKRADGDLFASIGSFVERMPQIEIDCLNPNILATTGAFQLALSAGVICYFQRVINGGGRYAWNTNNHIAVTAATGNYVIQEIPVDKDGDANVRITVNVTGQLTVATATTISLP